MMQPEAKIRTIDVVTKLIISVMIVIWLVIIYKFATSGLTMIRQLLGCMFTTMVIFGILSFTVERLKAYRQRLQETQPQDD